MSKSGEKTLNRRRRIRLVSLAAGALSIGTAAATGQAMTMQTVAADTFTRPNTAQGEPLGQTEVGGYNWGVGLNNLGPATHHPAIQNNRLHTISTINGNFNFHDDVGAGVQNAHIQGLQVNDFSLDVDMQILQNTTADAWMGLLWNKQSTSNDINDGYLFFIRPSGDWMLTSGIDGAGLEVMANGALGEAVGLDVRSLSLGVHDNTFTLNFDGKQLFSMADPKARFDEAGYVILMSNHGDNAFGSQTFERVYDNLSITVVPEPGSFSLLALAGLLGLRRRRL